MLDRTIRDVERSYDRVAEEYGRRIYGELEHKPFDRQLLDRFAAMVQGLGTTCDLGCGPGHVARYLHEQGVQVVGIDLSEAMVKLAQRLNPGINFQQGNMLSLDIGDEEWGGVAAFYSIIHVPRAVAVHRCSFVSFCADPAKATNEERLVLQGKRLNRIHIAQPEYWLASSLSLPACGSRDFPVRPDPASLRRLLLHSLRPQATTSAVVVSANHALTAASRYSNTDRPCYVGIWISTKGANFRGLFLAFFNQLSFVGHFSPRDVNNPQPANAV